jgi:predicted nucleotidyltransferase
MAAHVALRDRTGEKVARMVTAVADLKLALAAYAREHGGQFILFGSAARREMRPGSDVDILVEFPSALETEALDFAERECVRLGLKPDILSQGWAGARLRQRLLREGLRLPGDEQRWSGAMSMTDRLDDILDAARSAATHFRAAGRLFQEGGFEVGKETGYRNRMAFLHAMLSGHTALEDALVRAMKALGEAPPTGSDWISV